MRGHESWDVDGDNDRATCEPITDYHGKRFGSPPAPQAIKPRCLYCCDLVPEGRDRCEPCNDAIQEKKQ